MGKSVVLIDYFQENGQENGQKCSPAEVFVKSGFRMVLNFVVIVITLGQYYILQQLLHFVA